MEIDLIKNESSLLQELFGKTRFESGVEVQITDDAKLKYEYTMGRNAIDFPPAHHLILDIMMGFGTSGVIEVTKWFYNRLKEKKDIVKLKIIGKEVEIDQEKMREAIEKKLAKSK